MSRANTAHFTILSEILEFLSGNTTLVGKVFSDGLDLGLVSLGDMSAIEDIIMNLPGMIKGLVYPMIERWDDTLDLIKTYDNSIAGTGSNVEAIANMRVKKLFSDDMSITTLKYDANGNMTSEHTNWLATATGSAAPGTPSANSPRCYYQFSSTTPGSVMTVYHIVDAAEAKALAKTPDEINGSPAAYTYFKEKQTFVMSQEVEGSETYVWKATDEWNNTWS
jgi:YD repeat-containing protein